jgi:hypothetical protein
MTNLVPAKTWKDKNVLRGLPKTWHIVEHDGDVNPAGVRIINNILDLRRNVRPF